MLKGNTFPSPGSKAGETSFEKTFILLGEKNIKLMIRRASVVSERAGDITLLGSSFQGCCVCVGGLRSSLSGG